MLAPPWGRMAQYAAFRLGPRLFLPPGPSVCLSPPPDPFLPPGLSVRPAVAADLPLLSSWLDRARPLPVPAQRGRQLLLASQLSRPEQGGCLLCEAGGRLVGCLSFNVVPCLAQGGLAALALEWWHDGADAAPALAASCAMLADWCRAHGIRQLLLAPALVDAAAPPQGFAVDASGLWCRMLVPSYKRLG